MGNKQKYYTVYKTINQLNGHFYIGTHITSYPNDSYLGSGKRLKLAIKKYGIQNFKKEVLFSYDNEKEMFEKEKELTKHALNMKSCYNLCEGGRGGFTYLNKTGLNKRNSEDASRVAKRGNIDGWFSRKGRPLTDQHKEKISQFYKTLRPERAKKISLKMAGRKLSQETKDKISLAVKEKIKESYEKQVSGRLTPEGRKKMSETHKGKILSVETKKKISQSLKKGRHSYYNEFEQSLIK